MSSLVHIGGCHCGALRWTLETLHPITEFAPRACDCDFCTRHCAAWVSDSQGSLRIKATSADLQCYHQGSGQAEFLVCRNCGVLVAVIARTHEGHLRGGVNRNSFDQRDQFPAEVPVSPQQLAPEAKRARWSQLWTPTELI
ncbi:MAG TPA: aldehyde-activating protein [Lysobacter sp.]|jgi:hypothetical protein|nr:aldehyde-activating protein [Lysobacter sp.]